MSELIKDSSNKKQRLGRGLGSLLGGASAMDSQVVRTSSTPTVPAQKAAHATPTSQPVLQQAAVAPNSIEARVWQVPVEKLVPSKLQPRTTFVKEKLEELAISIKQNGILQPIVARKLSSGAFEIIAGERRWRAAQMAGLFEVPVLVRTLSNKETLELALIENIQREDLSAMEEAEAYRRLMTEFSLTQQQVSDKVGKDRVTVTNALRLLALPNDVKELLAQDKISAGHCKVLLGIEDSHKISNLAKKVVNQQLSVRKLEKEIARIKDGGDIEAPAEPKIELMNRLVSGLQEDLQKALGTKVTIEYKSGKGKVSINFYSDEELSEVVEKVKRGCRI